MEVFGTTVLDFNEDQFQSMLLVVDNSLLAKSADSAAIRGAPSSISLPSFISSLFLIAS